MNVYDCVDEVVAQRTLLVATVKMAYPYFENISIKSYAGGVVVRPGDDKEVAVDGLEGNDVGYCHLRIDLWNYGLKGVYYIWLQTDKEGMIEHSLSAGLYNNFPEQLDQDLRWGIENWLNGVLSRLRSVARCERIKDELVGLLGKNWKFVEAC